VSPVKYELGFYIPEDGILHSHCRERLKSYTHVTVFDIMNFRVISDINLICYNI
jgi:hypothetical protein